MVARLAGNYLVKTQRDVSASAAEEDFSLELQISKGKYTFAFGTLSWGGEGELHTLLIISRELQCARFQNCLQETLSHV